MGSQDPGAGQIVWFKLAVRVGVLSDRVPTSQGCCEELCNCSLGCDSGRVVCVPLGRCQRSWDAGPGGAA